eukprot:TRINITY_DN5127_c0_g1_i1.p1 TRINITY_DN5127_c0_g1~~TRINITY_DN5127_c0_g1_i1.p1  ORF type:complete len:568 (+),score=84.78 TRINITY_DN5127_c0_g1_i1:112-1815(+)
MQRTAPLKVVLDFLPGKTIKVTSRKEELPKIVKSVDEIEQQEPMRQLSSGEKSFFTSEASWMQKRMNVLRDELMDLPDTTSQYSSIEGLVASTKPPELYTRSENESTDELSAKPFYRPRAVMAKDIITSAFNTLQYVRRKKLNRFQMQPIMPTWVFTFRKNPKLKTFFHYPKIIDTFPVWTALGKYSSSQKHNLKVFHVTKGLVRLKKRLRRRTIFAMKQELKHPIKEWVMSSQEFDYKRFVSKATSYSSMDVALKANKASDVFDDLTAAGVKLADGPLASIFKKFGAERSNFPSEADFLRKLQTMYSIVCERHSPEALTHSTILSSIVECHRFELVLSLLSKISPSEEVFTAVALKAAWRRVPMSFVDDLCRIREARLSKKPSPSIWLARIIVRSLDGFAEAVREYRKWEEVAERKGTGCSSYESEMFNVLFRVGTPASGYGVWGEMKRRSVTITEKHISSWLHCCDANNDAQTALTVISLSAFEGLQTSWSKAIKIACRDDPFCIFPNLFLLNCISSTSAVDNELLSSLLDTISSDSLDYLDIPKMDVPMLLSRTGLLSPQSESR